MTIAEDFQVLVCNDADGGLRLSLTGVVGFDESQRLNQVLIGALRSGAPRIEVDLRSVAPVSSDTEQVLRAAQAVARHLHVELRVTGDGSTW